jgi:hypothetical protein
MSIKEINLDEFEQDFEVSNHNKLYYGEVRTDFLLINRILDLIPRSLYFLPYKKWLDPCCGNGYFMMCLYKRLFNTLRTSFPDEDERHTHIITNMLYMIDINDEHMDTLKTVFGDNANIINEDFLEYNTDNLDIDIIIANPPYNFPNKSNAIWPLFFNKFIHSIPDNGHLAVIIPSIWLKKSHNFHNFINQFHISALHTMDSTETHKIFHYKAQTPTTYFHLHKKPAENFIKVYDNSLKMYIQYHNNLTIPMKNQQFLMALKLKIKNNYIKAVKTNLDIGFRNKTTKFSSQHSDIYKYININSCILVNNNPVHKISYSDKPCAYHGIPKLILSHKMFGIPYYDSEGSYGIPTKDNYVILNKSHEEFLKLEAMFNSKCIRHIFNSFRYRMSNIEKEAFEFIPDLSLLNDIDWDFFDSSFLVSMKVGLDQYKIINSYKLPTKKFQKIFI